MNAHTVSAVVFYVLCLRMHACYGTLVVVCLYACYVTYSLPWLVFACVHAMLPVVCHGMCLQVMLPLVCHGLRACMHAMLPSPLCVCMHACYVTCSLSWFACVHACMRCYLRLCVFACMHVMLPVVCHGLVRACMRCYLRLCVFACYITCSLSWFACVHACDVTFAFVCLHACMFCYL